MYFMLNGTASSYYFQDLKPSYRAHCNKVVHLPRVKKIKDLNLIQNHCRLWNIGRATHVSVGILWLKKETRELSFLHGKQTHFQSSQCHICLNSVFEMCDLYCYTF